MLSLCGRKDEEAFEVSPPPPSRDDHLREVMQRLQGTESIIKNARDLLQELADPDWRDEAGADEAGASPGGGVAHRPSAASLANGPLPTFKHLNQFLEKEISETNSCLALPFTVTLFLSFIAAYHFHFRVETLHALDTAISWDITENANFASSGILPVENARNDAKSLFDVNSIPDFWSWFSMGAVNLWWKDDVGTNYGVSEVRSNVQMQCQAPRDSLNAWDYNISAGTWGADAAYPPPCPETGANQPRMSREGQGLYHRSQPSYLYFHSIVGGVRLRQERRARGACIGRDDDPGLVDSLHTGACVGPSQEAWLKPELHQALLADEAAAGQEGATVYLLSGWSSHEVRTALRGLEDGAWLTPLTQKVQVIFTVYNPSLDVITAVHITFLFNRGGHVFKILDPTSIWLHPYHHAGCYVADCLWALLAFKLFAEEFLEIMKSCRIYGVKRGLSEYLNIGTFVDWISVFHSLLLGLFWLSYLRELGDLRLTLKRATPGESGSWSDPRDRAAFYGQVDTLVRRTHLLVTLLAFYPFVMASRFFKAFSAQARLALVTATISEGWVDLVHFGVVFSVIFVLFATSAMILFGQELSDFANGGRSVHTAFRVLIGEFSWSEMIVVGRVQSYIWFTCFFVLVNWIMLNMLIAIVMDKYAQVKSSISSGAETLWGQAYDVIQRKYEVWFRGQVSYGALLEEIQDEDEATPLVEEELMDELNKIRRGGKNQPQVKYQCKKIIEGCRFMLRDEEILMRDSSIEALNRLKTIEAKLVDMADTFAEVEEMVEERRRRGRQNSESR